jgi:SAM-dependent methyltransferase
MRDLDEKSLFYNTIAYDQDWDEFANNYETALRLRLIFKKVIHPNEIKGSQFLDAGSGGGHFSAMAAALGAEVYSLDIGKNLLDKVAKKCKSHRILGNVLNLPLKDNSFQIVLSTEVVEHTSAPKDALGELARIVKPEGILVVTMPCRLWQPLVRLATKLKLRPYKGYENFLWLRDLKRILQRHGFIVEYESGFNFCPIFWKKLDPLFKLFDRIYGKIFPGLMVNLVIRARKKHSFNLS